MKPRLIRAGQAMFAGLSVLLAFSVPGQAYASGGSRTTSVDQETPPGDRIVVEVATVNGSGCPAGTASVWTSPDNTHFRVSYRRYAAFGPSSDPTDFRKNCQLNLEIHIPQGYTHAIARADYRGVAYLSTGATGLLRTAYYFQGSPDTRYVNHPVYGPYSGRWRASDVTTVDELVFAPCGRYVNLNINTELRVPGGNTNPGSTNIMTMNSSDGDVDTLYHFHWKRCH